MDKLDKLLIEGLEEAVQHARGAETGVRETTIMVEAPDRIEVAGTRKRPEAIEEAQRWK